ncbi:glycosyltransferase family 39 protein [Methanocorpusculum vombati]|uniref:Glycosyltransferase family 39 protein n=1 Tax=Methanocorpusculum vombati TaxID=3002864 RepID=A0ABT4IKV4_9EURY|nr:glycosyltransferase family 39 protein [Methanocorpusculum vombati]MCZ9319248.1 glycosyltransferase family 39 protein [Methanocorpusculum sp.]MCZ0862388.1 glycosyltransferase family 39 protein [Methanocorpusculum vombati]MDE2521065.1 glycosyltransferase family 39 protein [Methanocorpusculum sp.]MDE2534291.1 glycosyltransferase family 39 protein [Methanocorpusculum sp.]MDE2546668.1 glycosyltransferase family 39 protein [Methanocorpusculum sp.]
MTEHLQLIKQYLLNNKYTVIVCVLTLVALFLRLFHLGYNSLWGDEIATVHFVSNGLEGVWNVMYIDGRPTPPLYYTLESITLSFLGHGEFAVRLLSAIFGAFSIPLIYLLGKELLDQRTGTLAAGILTVLIYHIYYSQEARCYTMLLFLFLIATLAYIRAMKTNQTKYWGIFALFSALIVWTHFIGSIGVGILLLHAILTILLTRQYGNIRNFLFSILGILLLVSPLFFVLVQVGSDIPSAASVYGLGVFFLPQALLKMFNPSINTYTILGGLFVVAALICWIIGMRNLYKTDKNALLLVGMVCILPLVFGEIVNILGFDVWYNHFIFILPFFLIGIANCINFSPNPSTKKILTVLVLIGVLLYVICGFPGYYATYTKDDWKGTADFLSNQTLEGDHIFGGATYYYNATADKTSQYSLSLETLQSMLPHDTNSTVSAYLVFSFDLSEPNVTEIASSGSPYLDKIIAKIDTAGKGDTELINWILQNTEEIATFSSKSPYHEIHVHKVMVT